MESVSKTFEMNTTFMWVITWEDTIAFWRSVGITISVKLHSTTSTFDSYLWLLILAKSWPRSLVQILAASVFPTWHKSKVMTSVCLLTKSRLVAFPWLMCTWQADKWLGWGQSIIRYEWPCTPVMGMQSQWQGKKSGKCTQIQINTSTNICT
jgi:hypothetical protein